MKNPLYLLKLDKFAALKYNFFVFLCIGGVAAFLKVWMTQEKYSN